VVGETSWFPYGGFPTKIDLNIILIIFLLKIIIILKWQNIQFIVILYLYKYCVPIEIIINIRKH
jgi:hypothetical protein